MDQLFLLYVSETCKCERDSFFNWFNNPPYVTYNATTRNVEGFFPTMMEDILKEVCGTCALYSTPKFFYDSSKTGSYCV